MRIFKFKVFNCENIKFKRKCLIFYYPATSFIIVEIHQTATLFTWTFFIVLLSFANIDETLREPIAILFYDFIVNNFVDRKRTINETIDLLVSIFNVVSASSPDPFLVEALGSKSSRTATRRQLTFATSSRNWMHNSSSSYWMGKSCFTTPYIITINRKC